MSFTFRIEMIARVTIDAPTEAAARKLIDDASTEALIEMADAMDWEVERVPANELTD